MFLEFLKEFAALTHTQQRVFIYCVEKLPHPRCRSGDIAMIARSLGVHRESVRYALRRISASCSLSRAVVNVNIDIKTEIQRMMNDEIKRSGELVWRGIDERES
jgi:hypothetical protein